MTFVPQSQSSFVGECERIAAVACRHDAIKQIDAARDSADCVTSYWDWRPRVNPGEYYQYFGGTAPTHHLYGLREALDMIMRDAVRRKIVEFEATDSQKEKVTYLYRLLVHDKLIQPLAKGQENEPNMKHKLALWISRQLPEDHPLLN